MKRVWGHLLAGLALVAGGGAVTSACVHDDVTIFVRNVLAAPLVSNGQQCTFTTDPTQLYISSGTLDTAFLSQYSAVFLVANQMVPRGDPNTPRAETSIVTIQGAVVRITDIADKQLSTFTWGTSATINQAVGNTPSFEPISTLVLDSKTVRKYGPPAGSGSVVRFVTYTRFFGHSLGGQYVESDEFAFPVDVCRGCLITFAPQDISPAYPTPNCVGNGTASQTLPLPCFPGQDQTIDCSQCQQVPECHGRGPINIPVDAGAG